MFDTETKKFDYPHLFSQTIYYTYHYQSINISIS